MPGGKPAHPVRVMFPIAPVASIAGSSRFESEENMTETSRVNAYAGSEL
jgi:hypothetical protein